MDDLTEAAVEGSRALDCLDPTELVREVERYLAAVDAFRREGCEPRWLPELAVVRPLVRRRGARAIR